MVWSEAQRFDFHVAQFRFGEESRRIKAQRAAQGLDAPVQHESDEEARISNRQVMDAYFKILGYGPKQIARERSQAAKVWRRLDTRM